MACCMLTANAEINGVTFGGVGRGTSGRDVHLLSRHWLHLQFGGHLNRVQQGQVRIRFLGELDVTEKAHQNGDRTSVLTAEYRCDFRAQ